MDLQSLPEGPASTIGTIIASIGATLLFLRRRLSQDKVEVKKDEAEVNMLEVLQHERDDYRKRFEQLFEFRLSDTKLIGELTNKVEQLVNINDELTRQVQGLRKEVHTLRDNMQTLVNENEVLKLGGQRA